MFSTFYSTNFDSPIESKLVTIEHPKLIESENLEVNVAKSTGRSRFGCLTCRKKKKKCDEQRPVCGLCLKQNHSCVWRAPGTERRNKKKKEQGSRSSPEKLLSLHTENVSNVSGDRQQTEPVIPSQPHSEDLTTEVITEVSSSRNYSTAVMNLLDNIPKSPSFLLSLQELLNPAFENFKVMESTEKNEKEVVTDSPLGLVGSLDSPSKITDFFVKYYSSPHILSSPSNSLTKELDDQAIYYLDYYRTCVATTVSIAPVESNYFLNFYIPMANVEKSVLFAIIGWGGMFMNGSKDNVAYSFYMKSSIELCKEKLRSQTLSHNEILVLLTTLTILLAAEVCVGDVKQWYVFFEEIYRIIKTYGLKNLIDEFGHPNELRWLILNFLYHDVLSSRSLKNGTFFKPIEYKELLQSGYEEDNDDFLSQVDPFSFKFTDENYGADPLQGCVRPLYLIIGEIINCSVEFKENLEHLNEEELKEIEEFELIEDSDYMLTNFHCISLKQQKYELYNKVEATFHALDEKIMKSKPNDIALSYLDNDSDLELHLTLFESYQLTAQIYLRMLVLEKPPCSADMQRLLYNLTNCIDILIGSKVQASLCFPLLVAGLQCVSKLDRTIMLKRFEHMVSHFPVMNFKLVKEILEKAWLGNEKGKRCVNWSRITEELGWDLCVS